MTLDAEMLTRLDGLKKLAGHSLDEIEALVKYAALVPVDLAIVELGVFVGQGTCCLLAGSMQGHRAPVFAVDQFGAAPVGFAPYDDRNNLALVAERAAAIGAADLLTLVTANSQRLGSQWERPVGLLVVDADHRYESVRADVDAWSPHIQPGAMVCMHDARSDQWPGIDRVIAEMFADKQQWEVMEFVEPFSQWFRRLS